MAYIQYNITAGLVYYYMVMVTMTMAMSFIAILKVRWVLSILCIRYLVKVYFDIALNRASCVRQQSNSYDYDTFIVLFAI